ncbi:MAG TPA: bifunctional hydroxymethylpyrimidine kinase/phosphomethylpyrimidine kinase, partial [Rhodospirillales bacterium]|nr:bifunctional hydroxymethylpyrimidine kinase/phosphomethylpyrimidine kinase [Rhodospirillales bacterium]
MKGRVLVVAGSDSSGGAGIQADIKTVTALGGYAATAITALTAQNSLGVSAVLPVPADFVTEQMTAVLSDIGADAVKIGMLGDAAVVEAVALCLDREAAHIPLVVDPVMVAKGGQALLDGDGVSALKSLLIGQAAIVTPNLPEAEVLTDLVIGSLEAMEEAAWAILETGAQAVLLKGGHLDGETVTDVLVSAEGAEVFEVPRIETKHTHGTGCTL